jgi:hypothetical protein
MSSRLSFAIAPVIILSLAPAALAQQRDLTAGSGDHMYSYGPTQNAAPQAATPQQPRVRASRNAAARANAAGAFPNQTSNVSGRPAPAGQRQVPADPTADHMIYYGPQR